MTNEFRATASSASLIGLTAFGGAVIGFFLQLVVAYYFGASAETDAYFMALSTSELLSKLLLGGSITAVFIPIFVEHLTRQQRHEAWQLALNVLHITAAIFLVVTTLLGVFAEPFIHFIAPGFDAATSSLTIKLLRVLLPSFVLLYVVELATAILHSVKQFAIPAMLRLIAPSASIIAVLLLARSLGIYSLAIGSVAGAVLQLSFLVWGLKRQGFNYHFIFQPHDPVIRRIWQLVYPFIVSVLVTQAAGITYRVLVSSLTPGSLAALKFAEKITQLLTLIFLNSVTMVIFPLLSSKAAARDYVGMRETIAGSVRLILFTLIPIIISVMLLRHPLIAVIYQRGSFSESDAAFTAVALLYLVLGLALNGVSSVFGHATLALQQTRVAVAVTVVSHAVAIYLFVLLVPRLSHAGLALGSSLVPIVIALLYFLSLRQSIPRLALIFWHTTYLKIVALALLLTGVITFTRPLAASIAASAWVHLFLPGLAGAAVFLAGAYLWRIPEMHTLVDIVKGKLVKWQQ